MSVDDGKTPALVLAAERVDRARALLSGYLRKRNSSGRWQRRYFQILPGERGVSYFVYAKSSSPSAPLLAAMDLSRAGRPELVAAGTGDDASGSGGVFAITWDRYRTFQASSRDEAGRWVDAILRVQAQARRFGIPAPGVAPGAVPAEWGGKDGAAQRLTEAVAASTRFNTHGGGSPRSSGSGGGKGGGGAGGGSRRACCAVM